MKTLLRACAGVLLLFASIPGWASTTLAYLAMFECPTCFKIQDATARFQSDLGANYAFVPVAIGPDDIYSGLWYALKDESDKKLLGAALFRALHTMRMPDIELAGVIEYLRLQGIGSSLSGPDIAKRVKSPENIARMRKSARLLSLSGAVGVPTAVVIKNGKIVRTVEFRSGMSPDDFVRDALAAFQQEKAK